MTRVAVIAIVAAARIAHSEPTFAVAINEPYGWIDAHAFGVSGYAALDSHQVVHANVANWSHDRSFDLHDLQSGLEGADSDNKPFGRLTDVGLAYMYFPRRAYDGPSLEAGVLVRIDRSTDSISRDPFDGSDVDNFAHHTTTIGGRALVGWSWLVSDRVFISAQLGISVGQEFGTETETHGPMAITTEIDKSSVAGEGLVRFGVIL